MSKQLGDIFNGITSSGKALFAPHIYILLEPPRVYTEEEIRRIALSNTHFEHAFEVLVLLDRSRNTYAEAIGLMATD
jgi:hypothetical protein